MRVKIICILTAVLIALFAISFYFLTQKYSVSDEPVKNEPEKIIAEQKPAENNITTRTWQTYRNEKYGFEVAHPGGWYYDGGEGNENGVTPFSLRFSDTSLEFSNLAQGVYPKKFVSLVMYKTAETIDEYSTSDLAAKNAAIEFQKEIQISGQKGVMAKSTFNNIIYLSAYVKKGEFIYIFESPISDHSVYGEAEEMFNTIITHFIFIK